MSTGTVARSAYRKQYLATYSKHGHVCDLQWHQIHRDLCLVCYGSRWNAPDDMRLILGGGKYAEGPCRPGYWNRVFTPISPRVTFAGGSCLRFLPVDRVVVHLPLVAHLWSFLARSYPVRTGRVGRPRIVRPVSFSPSAQYALFF